MELQVKEQTGFSAIEMLLCTIIVLMVGFIGYYVYHTQQATNATISATSKIAQDTAPKSTKKAAPKTTVETATTPTDTTQYLDIKEWAVKIPLSSGISGAVTATKSDGYNLGLSTKALAFTSCSADGGAPGVLHRYSSDTTSTDYAQNTQKYGQTAVKVGSYYYVFEHGQSACSADSNVQAQADLNATAFAQAVKSIQVD